ncbi:MAG: beta-glucosidase, partial [Clostridiaceae bacterium]|nr:beta-glucosidase [Clostridiaceae bacterium]
TASEMIATGVNWNFAPCVAVARDPRWGRIYESYSENPDLVRELSVPYIKALQEKYNITACAKHYAADGGTDWGTGYKNGLIDQGDTQMSEEELRKTHISVYEEAVKAGVKTVMISFSSWKGIKNHQNKELIQGILKDELGFKGFVISDYEAIHQLPGKDIYKQLVSSVNAGVDMFMEPDHWIDVIDNLKKAVEKGDIKQERIDDAVLRILKVKLEMGLFENPVGDQKLATALGEDKSRLVAKKAVKESLVLLKNENKVLPIKKNAKVFVAGPASNNVGIQCGGWTISWQGGADAKDRKWTEGTTILEGFKRIAQENGGVIVTDPKEAGTADVAVIVIGEKPYAEYEGDDGKLDLYSGMALDKNREALEQAKAAGIPTVVVMVSGRPRIVTDEIANWDAFVAAWLPGTEGDGVADVLYGLDDFSGKLSFTWPREVGQIPVNYDSGSDKSPLFPYGFGLKMNN